MLRAKHYPMVQLLEQLSALVDNPGVAEYQQLLIREY
jgi:hypothetical protein